MSSDTFKLGLFIGLGFILFGGGYMVYSGTRGLRNNNPGNIKYDGTAWQGLASPPSDGTFCVFTSPEYGIRAMAVILTNYVAVDGIPSTVTDLISRWAPSNENDTASYIQSIDTQLGLIPGNDSIDLYNSLPVLISAMISHENGINPYSASTLANGIALAA